MEPSSFLTTIRLTIFPLSFSDESFILELLNTEGWIKFIGNRNILSLVEARAYIQKILDNPNISYWIVRLKESKDRIGIVTWIKRDYLEYHDIGFAFLPNSAKKGYAYEATISVLNKLIKENNFPHVLAITIPENMSSIKLLEKMGFEFEKELEIENEKLHIYGVSVDKFHEDTDLIPK